MRLTLRQLLIFAAVADSGSTTAAGLKVALSQSATSSALNELEGLLKNRLFDRIGKRLLLNDTGRALLPQARALLDGAAAIERDFGIGAGASAATSAPSRLRIGASTTIGNYLLPSLVAGYRGAWPGVHVDATIANTRDISVLVSRFEVDAGLIEGPSHEPDLRTEPWIDDELVIVCSPAHPLLESDPNRRLSLKTLGQASWLLREPGSGTREAVENALLPHVQQLREEMHFGNTEAIKQAAAAGLGLTCLSRSAVQDLLVLGRLRVVETELPRLSRRFYLIHHARKQFSSTLERFLAYCRLRTAIRRPPDPVP